MTRHKARVIRMDPEVVALAISKSGTGHGLGVDPRMVCARLGGASQSRVTRWMHRNGWASCRPLPYGNCWHHEEERVGSTELRADVHKSLHVRLYQLATGHLAREVGDPVTLLQEVQDSVRAEAAADEAANG